MNSYPVELATIHHRELLAEALLSHRAQLARNRRRTAARSHGRRSFFSLSRFGGGRR
jgi:hypothetical protein